MSENIDPHGPVSDEIIERFKKVAVSTVFGALSALGYMPCFMKGVRAVTPGNHLVHHIYSNLIYNYSFWTKIPDIIFGTNFTN